MSIPHFVILILCTQASLDDLLAERARHDAVPVDILHYQANTDYFRYRENKFDGQARAVDLMFVFGQHDSVIVRDDADMKRVKMRLASGEC